MTELTFAKQFLTTLDNKNTKYQPDHVFDAKTFALRIPYTLPKLPHPPHPTLPPSSATPSTSAAPGSEPAARNLSVTLKSTRNPSMALTLPSVSPTTPIATLRQQVHAHLGGAAALDKIKILLNKKPVPASKLTVADAVGAEHGGGDAVEFGVMVIGGAPDPVPLGQGGAGRGAEAAGPGSENAAVEARTGRNPEDQENRIEMLEGGGGTEGEAAKGPVVRPGETGGVAVLDTTEFWDDLQGFLEQRLRDQAEAGRLRKLFENVSKSA